MSAVENINWSPIEYEKAAFLAKIAGEEMLSRLQWMTLKPATILDVGAGTGLISQQLQAYYPDATVFLLDQSEVMLRHAASTVSAKHVVCANANILPFQDNVFDMVFANFILSWQPDFKHFLQECRRVLAPEGLLMINAIGPTTLHVWRDKLQSEHLPCFIDMHDLGDMLLQTGFADPVVDINTYTATYQDKDVFARELQQSGFWFPDSSAALVDLTNPDMDIEWDTEVAYAHAFKPAPTDTAQLSESGEAKIPLAALRRQLRQI